MNERINLNRINLNKNINKEMAIEIVILNRLYPLNNVEEAFKILEEYKEELGNNFIRNNIYFLEQIAYKYTYKTDVEEIFKSIEEHKEELGDNFIQKHSYLCEYVVKLYYQINNIEEILKSVDEHKKELGDYFIQKHNNLWYKVRELIHQINDKEKIFTSIKKYRHIIGEQLISEFLTRISVLYRDTNNIEEILKSVEEHKEELGDNFIQKHSYLCEYVVKLYYQINNIEEIFKSVEKHKEVLGNNFIQKHLALFTGVYSQMENEKEILESIEKHKKELGNNFIQEVYSLSKHVAELYGKKNDIVEILESIDEHKEVLGNNFVQNYLSEHIKKLYYQINNVEEMISIIKKIRHIIGEDFINQDMLESVAYLYRKYINNVDEILKSVEEHKEELGDNFIQEHTILLDCIARLYEQKDNVEEILKSVEEHKEELGDNFIQEHTSLLDRIARLYEQKDNVEEIFKSIEEHKEELGDNFIQEHTSLLDRIARLFVKEKNINNIEEIFKSVEKHKEVLGDNFIQERLLYWIPDLYKQINNIEEIFKSVEEHKEELGDNFIQDYLLEVIFNHYNQYDNIEKIFKSIEEHKEELGDNFIQDYLLEFIIFNRYNQSNNIEEIIISVEKHLNILLGKHDLKYIFSKALNFGLAKKIMNEVKYNQINNIDEIIKEKSNIRFINDGIIQGAILKVTKQKIEYSNSIEIIKTKDVLIDALLLMDINKVEEYYSSIENMFLRNNIPVGLKLYQIFKILNSDSSYLTSEKISSPTLLSEKISLNKKYELLQNDMIRVTMGSNPCEMYRYIDKMQSDLIKLKTILEFKNNNPDIKYEELNDEYKKYISKILQIANAWGFVYGFNEKDIYVIYNEYLNENLVEGIENWIISIFSNASSINFSTLSDLKKYVRKKANDTNDKNKNEAEIIINNGDKYKLEVGDYIKGVMDYEKYLKDILESGVNCKEMLGSSAGSDCTHLDTDLSIISNNSDDINIAMNGTTAGGFSNNLWFVFKDKNNRFNKTNINDDNLDLSSTKMELFPLLGQAGNYGVRSGIPSSEIDFMICNNFDSWIGYAIAMNGIYIPVVDKNGKVVFSPDDFKDIRKELAGLKRYYADEPILSESYKTPGLNNFVDEIRKDRPNTQMTNDKIKNVISNILREKGYYTVYNLSNDYTSDSVELIGTGSTERGNNAIGDCDFDYMLRLNNEMFENRSELFDKLCELFNGLGGVPIGGHKQPDRIRYENIFIEGIEKTIDIDVSFEIKTNKVKYTSDIALKEKMDSIREKYGEDTDYVSANIVLAKKILKNGGIYKKTEGGIGGIGVENWILKNNGSLIDAIESFLDAAKKSNGISEFINNYSIFDFGENFYSNGYNGGHDNYTRLLNDEGLKLMKETLENFLKEYNEALKNGNVDSFINEFVGVEPITEINTNSSVRR